MFDLSPLVCTRRTPVLLHEMARSLALVYYRVTISVAPFMVRAGRRV